MHSDQVTVDLAELGLSPEAGFRDVKAAFRRLVLNLHPDAPGGGDVKRFIRVYAAYQRLSEHFRDSASSGDDVVHERQAESLGFEPEPLDELQQRLLDLMEAFARIGDELIPSEEDMVAELRKEFIQAFNRASSCSELDGMFKKAAKIVTRDVIRHLSQHMNEAIGIVAGDYNDWMRSWLTPFYESVRVEDARRWWRSGTAAILSICGLAAGVLVAAGNPVYIAASAPLGALLGWLAAAPVHRVIGAIRYNVQTNVPAIEAQRVRFDRSHLAALRSAASPEDIAALGGMAGLWALGGPWGALAGLVVGGIAGAIFGEDVAERRKRAVEQLDAFLPKACREIRWILLRQLDTIASEMKREIEDNYRAARSRAARCVHLLPAPV
jgi:hypothetical protein